MFYYIIGFIFILLFISYLYMFGYAMLLNKYDTVSKFLSGYVVYSALIAVVGIPIQFFKLPWMMFLVYMIFMLTATTAFIIIRTKRHKLKFFEDGWVQFLKDHWLIFAMSLLLILITLSCVTDLWQNNMTDDGFYLTKIATIPYISNPFATIPASGLPTGYQAFDAYVFNTWELEASVFVYLLKIPATLFTRFFMSGFNYFLFGCTIYEAAKRIFNKLNVHVSSRQIQYTIVILLLFSFSGRYLFMMKEMLNIDITDSWQFVTAMYYGSVTVRTSGVLLLLIPLLGIEKITFKEVFITAMTALVLLSKSTIAVPIVFVISVAYLTVHFAFKNRKSILFIGAGSILAIIGANFLNNNIGIDTIVNTMFQFNIQRDILFVAVLLLVIAVMVFRNKFIIKMNMIIVVSYFLILWNPINNIFELTSVYDFVGLRALTAVFYLTIVLATIYLFAILFKVCKQRQLIVDIVIAVLTITLTCGSLYAMDYSYGSIKKSYATVWNNKMLVPDSTIQLGEALEKISNSTDDKINVVMPAGLHINEIPHFPSAIIRCYAPKIISVTSILRFLGGTGTDFEGYSLEDQAAADNFSIEPNEQNLEAFKQLLKKYPKINCFVFVTDRAKELLEELGFKGVSSVIDSKAGIIYYVYLSNNVNTE